MKLELGQPVRYKPGGGTYGYEDALESDGRVPAEVIGFSQTRVRIRFTTSHGWLRGQTRSVDEASLA